MIDVFLEVIGIFERQLFLRAFAKMQLFYFASGFHQARGQKRKHGIGGKCFTCFIES